MLHAPLLASHEVAQRVLHPHLPPALGDLKVVDAVGQILVPLADEVVQPLQLLPRDPQLGPGAGEAHVWRVRVSPRCQLQAAGPGGQKYGLRGLAAAHSTARRRMQHAGGLPPDAPVDFAGDWLAYASTRHGSVVVWNVRHDVRQLIRPGGESTGVRAQSHRHPAQLRPQSPARASPERPRPLPRPGRVHRPRAAVSTRSRPLHRGASQRLALCCAASYSAVLTQLQHVAELWAASPARQRFVCTATSVPRRPRAL